MWKLSEIQISVLINKVYWNTATSSPLSIVCGCFCVNDDKSWTVAPETVGPAKAKILTLWPFTGKIYQPRCRWLRAIKNLIMD